MKDYIRLAGRLYNTPLMILPAKGEIIEQVFRSRVTDEPMPEGLSITIDASEREMAYAGTVSAKRMDGGYLRTDDGIALVPILGTLVHRGSSMDAASGLTSYQRISSQLNAAMADPQVRGTLLEVDSMGGEAAGVFELAQSIRAMSAQKPIFAIANQEAMSAAYLLGSAAEELYLPETGMVGSIGVVMYHVDRSKALEKQGVVYTPVYAGARKVDFAPYAPLSPDAQAWAQDSVNRTYDHFVRAVVQNRGVSAEAVRGTEGVRLHADQAVQGKFVTGIATFSDVYQRMLAKVNGGLSTHGVYGARASASNAQQEQQMDEKQPKAAASSSGPEITQQQLDTAVADAQKKGVSVERERIGAILNCEEAKTRQALARHIATSTDLTVEAATAMLKASPVEAAGPANLLAARMAAEAPNPDVGVSGGNSATAPVRIDSAQVYKLRADAVSAAK